MNRQRGTLTTITNWSVSRETGLKLLRVTAVQAASFTCFPRCRHARVLSRYRCSRLDPNRGGLHHAEIYQQWLAAGRHIRRHGRERRLGRGLGLRPARLLNTRYRMLKHGPFVADAASSTVIG
jgi:hypothetical protein